MQCNTVQYSALYITDDKIHTLFTTSASCYHEKHVKNPGCLTEARHLYFVTGERWVRVLLWHAFHDVINYDGRWSLKPTSFPGPLSFSSRKVGLKQAKALIYAAFEHGTFGI